MRAAATVVRLMPSPRNRITFFARPFIAPLVAARAAPLRYHQAGVSPAGCAIGGTSIRTFAGPSLRAGVAAQAASRVRERQVRTGANRRIEDSMQRQCAIMPKPQCPADDIAQFQCCHRATGPAGLWFVPLRFE